MREVITRTAAGLVLTFICLSLIACKSEEEKKEEARKEAIEKIEKQFKDFFKSDSKK